jgi:hypothetical protein
MTQILKKILYIPFLAITLISCSKSVAQKPDFKEHISKEFTVKPNDVLALYNVQGFVKVEGYDGNKVLIEIDKTISAKNQDELEIGKNEFKLNMEQQNDSLIVYITEPFDSRPRRNNNRWGNDNKIHYNYHLDFSIKVPKSMSLTIFTVNDGDINIANIDGLIKANNVNGKIILENVKAAYDVHTINGEVKINFLALPPDNAKFYTLNGKMTVILPNNFSADCSFKSFNGEFYTDFENTEKLPHKITKTVDEHNGKTTQKLNKTEIVRFGSGGKNVSFETFNGNIYIKKTT